MDQYSLQLLTELTTDITFVVITGVILYYALKKEKLRQEMTDTRNEKLLTAFVNTTTDYMAQTIRVIDGLPQRQGDMIENILDKHLESVKLIIAEMKANDTLK